MPKLGATRVLRFVHPHDAAVAFDQNIIAGANIQQRLELTEGIGQRFDDHPILKLDRNIIPIEEQPVGDPGAALQVIDDDRGSRRIIQRCLQKLRGIRSAVAVLLADEVGVLCPEQTSKAE